MKRIAVICCYISPYRGSECSVAWNFVINMAKNNELYVLYGSSESELGKVEEIKEWEKSHVHPNIHFVDVILPENRVNSCLNWYSAKCQNTILNIADFIRHKRWHKAVLKKVVELKETGKIDVVHFLNPIGFKEPGLSWKIKGIPYGWGPISGVHKRAWGLRKCMNLSKRIETYMIRNNLHPLLFKYNSRVRKAIKRCDFIFAATPTTLDQLSRYHRKEAIYLPENGIMEMEVSSPVTYAGPSPLQLIWIGCIDDRKALVLLLEALTKIKDENWHLNVVGGGGTLRDKMIQYGHRNGISSKITWYGVIPRLQVIELLKSAHLHVISSLGEATTTVLFEAMSCGVPTMSLDHCGMAGVICEKCGIKIPIQTQKQVTDDMASQISRLINHPNEITQLSKGVLECSQTYLYQKRLHLFEETYEKAIDTYKHYKV